MAKNNDKPPLYVPALRVLRGKALPPRRQWQKPVEASFVKKIDEPAPMRPLPVVYARRLDRAILKPPPRPPAEPDEQEETADAPPLGQTSTRVVRQLNLVASLLRAGRLGITVEELQQVQGYDDLAAPPRRNDKQLPKLTKQEEDAYDKIIKRAGRDMESLREDGVLVESTTEPDGVLRYRLSLGAVMARPVCLADDELLLLEDVVSRYSNAMSGEFGRHLLSAAVKLKAGTPNAAAADVQVSGVASGPSPRLADGGRLLACLEGIAERITVRLSYQSVAGTKPSPRTVDPYRVIRRGPHLYLYGTEHETGQRKTFRLSRMRGTPKLLREEPRFEAPDLSDDPNVPAPVMLEGGNGTIRNLVVEFDADVAFMVANELGGQHVMRATPSGGVRLALRRAFPGELFAYLADYAGHFRVIGPKEAVLDIRARLEETLTLYGA